MSRKLKSYFYAGSIVILPIFLTVFIINWMVNFVVMLSSKSFTVKLISEFINKFGYSEIRELKYIIYFFYVLGIILFIIFVGYITRNILGRKITSAINKIMYRLPIIKHIYSTINQIVNLISSNKNTSYKKAVLIEYPKKGIYSIGFLTSETNPLIENIVGDKVYNIFVPTSPNPTSGMFIAMKQKDVKVLDIKIEDAIKLVISGGVLIPGMENKHGTKK
ncbi:MAG: DUF502 domain-containing protein [Fusobacterium sp. JB021]|nr:DUF502 domain-containing protein [Fusobacterium sp. JB020]MDP0493184.1 DUF502 domain-containing protein [Fusobacterium sp. JB021]MDP0506110.1 DUF502 domain-containing protein [Fusobacterium sp. JB019]